jgi:geranylgeranyl reductase family protein
MEKEYDVIIVGAGPAGCSAAICLARRGYEVLLMDKAKFPRDKVCGDGINPLGLEVLDRLGALPQMMTHNPRKIEGIDIFSPAGQMARASFSHLEARYKYGWVFPRREFDFLLWQLVGNFANIQALENCKGLDLILAGRKITGVRAQYGDSLEGFAGRVIIGADGAYSRMAKRVFPSSGNFQHYAFAVRGYFRKVEGLTDQIEIHCEKNLLPGYGWIFPTGEDSANVGVGISSRFLKKKDMKKLFHAFIEENPAVRERFRQAVLVENSFKGFPIPWGTFTPRRSHENVLLLGDAARFADVLTGEGIYYALQGGECAAEAIHEGLKTTGGTERIGEFYEKSWRRALDPKEYLIGRFLQRLVIGEFFLNLNVRRACKNPVMARNLASILCHEKTKMKLLF